MATQLTDDDEGKDVVMDGEQIGIVAEVRDGRAYVNPDAGLTDKLKASLDWGDDTEDTYALELDLVESVTDDEIRTRTTGV